MKTPSSTVLLTLTLTVAPLLAVACGGAQPTPATATPDGTSTSTPGAASVTPSTSSTAPAGVGTLPGPAPSGKPGFTGPMKPVVASAMMGDLQNLGLDLKTLPPLSKLEPDKLRKVMKTFTKALGVKCNDCHNDSDYQAMTPMKKITLHMWDDFTRSLAQEDGTALYCDSCHQGRAKFLDRSDKRALSGWMDKNFVAKLKRRDGKENSCETCHGDPFEGDIFAERWLK